VKVPRPGPSRRELRAQRPRTRWQKWDAAWNKVRTKFARFNHPWTWLVGTVVFGGLFAYLVVNQVELPDDGASRGYAEKVGYIVDQVGVILGLTIVFLGLLSTVLAVLAHPGGHRSSCLDFAGKVCAAQAALLAFWVALLALPPLNVEGRLLQLCLLGILSALSGILLIRRPRPTTKEKPNEA